MGSEFSIMFLTVVLQPDIISLISRSKKAIARNKIKPLKVETKWMKMVKLNGCIFSLTMMNYKKNIMIFGMKSAIE